LTVATAIMNLTIVVVAVMVVVLGLALMASFQHSTSPEALSLAVWGIGLLAARLRVRRSANAA
jgi:uncharacterized membrane protein